MTTNVNSPLRVVVLISGNGSNLQAIIDDIETHNIPAQIVAVISNKPDAYGLTRAGNHGIETEVLENKDFDSREAYDTALQAIIDNYKPGLVVLAGFMRILTEDFVNYYTGRMINIHPSLLPRYQGLNTHQRVIEAGEKEHGASVHFVTPELDAGPVILQATVPVLSDDTAASLAKRVHEVEHKIYPKVVHWFADGRLKWEKETIYLDGKAITSENRRFSE